MIPIISGTERAAVGEWAVAQGVPWFVAIHLGLLLQPADAGDRAVAQGVPWWPVVGLIL